MIPPRSTIYERMLARRLRQNRVRFKTNPDIWLSACQNYTPDFIIYDLLIIEVDGGIHDAVYRKTPDRIRQRALERLGYNVYPVRNKEVETASERVVDDILQYYSQIQESSSRRDATLQALQKAPSYTGMMHPEDDYVLSIAIRANPELELTLPEFCKRLALIDDAFLKFPCHTERLLMALLGMRLASKNDGSADFAKYFDTFMRCKDIMTGLHGGRSGIYLVNLLNIFCANFFENLVFLGGPRLQQNVVQINSGSSLDQHISEFNENFSSVSVQVDPKDVATECRHYFYRWQDRARDKSLWLLEWLRKHGFER